MRNKKNVLIIASVALALFMSSCTTFSEKASVQDNEMLTFDNVSFDGVVKVEDLKNLGKVEAKRTVTYNKLENGDVNIVMGDYTYNYIMLTGETEVVGTRVIGKLNLAQAPAVAAVTGSVPGVTDMLGGLLGGLFGAAETSNKVEQENRSMNPKTIALEAVNYDLMAAATAKGGTSLLVPEYSWEIDEEQTGTIMKLLFMAPSKTYETQTIVYTVTARATVVTF